MIARPQVEVFGRGSKFRVGRFGVFFFQSYDEVQQYLSSGSRAPRSGHILKPGRLLIALEHLTGDIGRVHDPAFGDGFVSMAPFWDEQRRWAALTLNPLFVRYARNHGRMIINKDF